jgi:hypothetical protein
MDDVQRLVDEQLAKVRAENEAQVAGLQAQLDAARKAASPATSVPWNSGGVGEAIHDTWSQYEQALAHSAEEEAGREEALARLRAA